MNITTVCMSYNHEKCADPDCLCECHRTENARLMNEIKLLRDAFENYGHHLDSCRRRASHECDCGYDEAWTALVDERRGKTLTYKNLVRK